ncbi:MAG: L-lysine 6-transaminase [Ignavibacteriales bacterium]|nr:L-lysine 6-transaminase [Ignavibacteriales bacterium]MBP9119465.1 L-lysine 6-transaminase [Ignavibacterium sp.]
MNSLITDENKLQKKYTPAISADQVIPTLSKYMLADGFEIILDLEKSNGVTIIDQVTGDEYHDFFTFFASSPIGLNHPYLHSEEVTQVLGMIAVNKPSNSDIYTTYMAEFVETFAKVAKPDYMKHLFFISGGALAVENGLKVAFDWKVRKNFLKGYKEEKGHKVIHFKEAFHGRSGYTMSLTNTDPTKVKYFPKFDWPRITNPKIKFPLENNLEEVIQLEDKAIAEINLAIKKNLDDIAVIIIEPIQAEGGDNFFRKEFLKKLRDIADENEILLMFDEVQTGFGLTGKFWASDYYVKPDIIAFGKKAQVCGIMVSDRIDDIDDNVFRVSSRINSTWGADLTDMVRSKFILDVIKNEKLVDNANKVGEHLKFQLSKIQEDYPALISNTRGLGLMCSFDLLSAEIRNQFRENCYKEKLMILGCGEKSIRFRPALNITENEIDKGLTIIRKVLSLMVSNN